MNIESIQALFLASIALLAVLVIARPHWLIRPSFAFACLMSLVINPAAAFAMKPGYPDSPLFDSLRLSSVVFPLGVVAWVLCTPFLSTIARRVSISCRDGSLEVGTLDRDARIATWLGVAACGLLAAWYFTVTPFRSTGLWAVFFSAEDSMMAREEGLNLLDSVALKYAFSIGSTVVALTTLILLTLRVTYKRSLSSAIVLVIIIGILILIGITGARMPMAKVMLAVAITYGLTARRRSQLMAVPLGLAGAAFFVIAITLWRSGKGLLDAGVGLAKGVFDRAFVVPFETGLRTVQFAADRGFLDGANIRPYAFISDQRYIELPSEVYHAFYYSYYLQSQGTIESGSANTCFLFDFQAGFGIWQGWLLALIAIGTLDFTLPAIVRVRGWLRPALLAVLMLGIFSLASVAFTTALLTGGIGLIVVIAVLAPVLIHESPSSTARSNASRSATGIWLRTERE